MSIPVIDLAGALAPDGPRLATVAAAFRDAATSAGFFHAANHGVPAALIERQFALARRLMDLPDTTKAALSIHRSPIMRGFESLGAQTLDAGARPDLKESFYCGLRWPDDHPYVQAGYQTYGPNQWPAELPEAPAQCAGYIEAMLVLARGLMRIMAVSLALPPNYFDASGETPMVTLRMVRYPPQPVDADARTFGAGAHTDWGAVTILAEDRHGGLEVCLPDGRWVDAPPRDGMLVVNLGDMVPRWTNGLYRSNPHRVRNRFSGSEARHSIPFFYEPDYLARIEPVPGTVAPGCAPRYAPCTAGEHLQQKYRETYGHASAEAS